MYCPLFVHFGGDLTWSSCAVLMPACLTLFHMHLHKYWFIPSLWKPVFSALPPSQIPLCWEGLWGAQEKTECKESNQDPAPVSIASAQSKNPPLASSIKPLVGIRVKIPAFQEKFQSIMLVSLTGSHETLFFVRKYCLTIDKEEADQGILGGKHKNRPTSTGSEFATTTTCPICMYSLHATRPDVYN